MYVGDTKLGFEWNNGFLFSVVAIFLITMVRFGWTSAVVCTTLFFASLLAHEAGHLLVADSNHTRVKAIGFSKWGVYLRREKAEGVAELVISAAGPTVNLLIAYFLHDFTGSGILAWISQMNLFLFIVNMLPIGGSDGKRILMGLRELRERRMTLAAVPNLRG